MESLKNSTILAICYDFDKTLSPDDMQAQGFIQKVYDKPVREFWEESNKYAKENNMDTNLAYMLKMMETAHGKELFTKEKLAEYGGKVELFPGVETWFKRINEYGEQKNVKVEHYIISSGLKEMIEGTSIAKEGYFKKIYACAFCFDQSSVAKWPAQVVNYTNKTQFLFRIKKGVLDENDKDVNKYYNPEDVRVPFRNMVYIGDSETDIPCMKLVNSYGGHSIGVFNSETINKTRVYEMLRDERIRYFAPADYSEGEVLEGLIKAIIDRTATNEVLEKYHLDCCKEEYEARANIQDTKRRDLILSLSRSHSFESTHAIISDLHKVDSFSEAEKQMLFEIAISNNQVKWIINDSDIKMFYERICSSAEESELLQEIKELIGLKT